MEEVFSQISKFISTKMLWDFIIEVCYSLLVVVVSLVVIKLGEKFIRNIIEENKGDNVRRKTTLILLLKSTFKYVIYFVSGIIILSIFDIPVASLLAGAGILGLAVGFGAQSLVKDVINGFFILFEDQFAVGDYIETAGKDGIVEELGLRTTKIRNFGGQLHIIPNGEITQVTNFSNGNMRVMVDIGVAYDEDSEYVIGVLEEICEEVAQEKDEIITEGPNVLGVQELAASSVVIRIWAKVKPMEQWSIARYIRQKVKKRFDEMGIEIPYQHMVLMSKDEDKLKLGKRLNKKL